MSKSNIKKISSIISNTNEYKTKEVINNLIEFTDTGGYANLRSLFDQITIIDAEYSSFSEKNFQKRKEFDENTLYVKDLNNNLQKLSEINFCFSLNELSLFNIEKFKFDRNV